MIRRLIALAVEQPLVVLFAILGLAILGVHLASDLPIEAFPDVQDVQVQVISLAPGMAPEEVERSVSQPIEREMAGTPRAFRTRSVSITGLSVVTVTFTEKTNDYFARQQVTDRLSNVTLPTGIQPVLAPLSNAIGEVFRYALEVPDSTSEADARLIQDWFVRPSIRAVPGVADVVGFGGAIKEIQVRIDPSKLVRYGLTLADVQKAVVGGGDNAGAGIMNRGDQGFVIRAIALYRSPEDVGATAIAAIDGKPIRVRDVAEVAFGEKVRSGIVSVTQRNEKGEIITQRDRAVEGIVQMLKGGNAGDVTAAVRERVAQINERLAREQPGVKLVTLYQRTDLIQHTVHTVVHNMLVGIVLVVGVLYLFLRRWIPALIVASIIPFALLTALVGMQIMNVPANLMSLGAVDFGVVVDGAVVLVEAVLAMLAVNESAVADPQRRIDTVLDIGAKTASVILFSMTIIVCAFVPIFTFERVEGRIFEPVALTLTLALVGGLALTLTLVPALLSVVLRRRPIDEVHLRWMDSVRNGYQAILKVLMPRARLSLTLAVGVLVSALAAVPLLGTEFLPKLDEGNIWLTVGIDSSSSLENSKRIEREVRRALLEFPEVRQVIGQVGRPDDGTDPKGPNNLEVLADLNPRESWRYPSKEKLVESMSLRVRAVPGVLTNFSQVIQDNMEEALSGAKGEVVVKVFGADLQVLEAKGRQIAAIVEQVRGAADVAALPINGQAEVRIIWDREKLARYALSPADANALVQVAFGGNSIATFYDGERRLDVTLRLAQQARNTIDDIVTMAVPLPPIGDAAKSASVPIGELGTVVMKQGAARISREDGQRTVTVKMNLVNRDLGSFVAEARQRVLELVVLPLGYRLEWGGQFENQQRAMKRLQTILPLTFGAILALLYLAFREWKPALLVLAALPFSLLGGLAALALAGLHLSVSAAVGFIAVAGIAVQNSLIMVQQILDNLRAGQLVADALIGAGVARIRPILMTATIASLGLLPAALSQGIGAETQRPFALVIVGGVLTGTLASLLVLPLLASLVMRARPVVNTSGDGALVLAGLPK